MEERSTTATQRPPPDPSGSGGSGGGGSSSPRGFSLDWRRMLAEGLLIVGSVYLAIYLEGVSADRERVAQARDSLGLLRSELVEDMRDLTEILSEQEMLAGKYADLNRWLSDPAAIPYDSVQQTLDLVAYSNRTMFPRDGAWTTLLSEGHLSALDDPELVAHLGSFYGRTNDRVEYNGEHYDFSVAAVSREVMTSAWDFSRSRPVDSPERVRLLRDQLRFLQYAWNAWYMDLLGQYRAELESTLAAVESYLDEGAGS